MKSHFVKKIKGVMVSSNRDGIYNKQKTFFFKNSNLGKEDSFIGYSKKGDTLL